MLRKGAGDSTAQLAHLLMTGRGEGRIPWLIGRGDPISTGIALDVVFALAVAGGDQYSSAVRCRHGLSLCCGGLRESVVPRSLLLASGDVLAGAQSERWSPRHRTAAQRTRAKIYNHTFINTRTAIESSCPHFVRAKHIHIYLVQHPQSAISRQNKFSAAIGLIFRQALADKCCRASLHSTARRVVKQPFSIS